MQAHTLLRLLHQDLRTMHLSHLTTAPVPGFDLIFRNENVGQFAKELLTCCGSASSAAVQTARHDMQVIYQVRDELKLSTRSSCTDMVCGQTQQ